MVGNSLKLREVVQVSVLSSRSYDNIVTGGAYNGAYLSHTEIYSTATRQWRQGPSLPQPLHGMSSVQYEDTFVLVGGKADTEPKSSIYQYNQASETWILREEGFISSKIRMSAVLAGPRAAECNCCNKGSQGVTVNASGSS